jgi:hypothetical protein
MGLLSNFDKVISQEIVRPIVAFVQKWLHVNRFELIYQFVLIVFSGLIILPVILIGNLLIFGFDNLGSVFLSVMTLRSLYFWKRTIKQELRDWKSLSTRFENHEQLVPSVLLRKIVRELRQKRPLANILIIVIASFNIVFVMIYFRELYNWMISDIIEIVSVDVIFFTQWGMMHLLSVDDIEPRNRKTLSVPEPESKAA